jgi:hypothetical protein
MTVDPSAGAAGPVSDLEYDLAHEGVEPAAPGRFSDQDPATAAIRVATQTSGYDGDYSYDLAHDVPRT